jgi:hypothetical protein
MVGGYHMECEPFMITQEMLYDAILAADRMGKYYQHRYASNQEKL